MQDEPYCGAVDSWLTGKDILPERSGSFWQKYQTDAWSFRKPEWPEADCESDEFIDAGIVGESGEIAEHVKKKLRGDYRGQIAINPRYFDELCVGELGDVSNSYLLPENFLCVVL